MKCFDCGFENPEKSKFCGKCGKALAREDVELEKLTEEERIKLKLFDLGRFVVSAVFVFVFFLLILFYTIYIPTHSNSTSDPSGYYFILILVGCFVIILVLNEKMKTINKKLK